MSVHIVGVGDHPVRLPDSGQVVTIDQDLTLDQLRRCERALLEAGDPAGKRTFSIELHPITGECARSVVHLLDLDAPGDVVEVCIEVRA